MIDLITLAAWVCVIASLNWSIVEYSGYDLVAQVSPNPQVKMYIRYFIGVCALYFGLYAVTQLPKVPKTRAL